MKLQYVDASFASPVAKSFASLAASRVAIIVSSQKLSSQNSKKFHASYAHTFFTLLMAVPLHFSLLQLCYGLAYFKHIYNLFCLLSVFLTG